MATKEEVKKLAALARIRVEDAELEKLTSEFDAILAYVETISMVEMQQGETLLRGKPVLRNMMREDEAPHAPSLYTEKLVEQFSSRESDALSVKKIIHYDEAE
jgi:aspartyl/glutamyl-tRNA(Asn/Gln) amidotransferase C subunit